MECGHLRRKPAILAQQFCEAFAAKFFVKRPTGDQLYREVAVKALYLDISLLVPFGVIVFRFTGSFQLFRMASRDTFMSAVVYTCRQSFSIWRGLDCGSISASKYW